MSIAISKTVKKLCIGTEARLRATVIDAATKAAKDMSSYAVSFAIKAAPDETETYIVAPIAGTANSSGQLDVTIPEAMMVTVPQGNYTGEFACSVSGVVLHRIQLPIVVSKRVVVPVAP